MCGLTGPSYLGGVTGCLVRSRIAVRSRGTRYPVWNMLNLGDTAPDFSGTAAGGSTFTLSDYAGQNHVVLYFYIKDFTAG